MSSEYNGGAKVIELQRSGQQTKATELWSSNPAAAPPRQRDPRRRDDLLLERRQGQPGDPVSAVDARSGKILWQERSIEKATFVWADGKLITLDQDGDLMIAYPSPQGFKIAAKAPLLSSLAWTPPVLVGTRLYLRDRRTMMAVDLS